MKSIIKLLSLGLCLFCLFGCFCVDETKNSKNQTSIEDSAVSFSSTLGDQIWLVSMQKNVNKAGLLEVKADVFNSSNKVKTFVIKWQWFDENKTLIEEGSWIEQTILPNEKIVISSLAPKSGIKEFKLNLSNISQIKDYASSRSAAKTN